MTPSSFTRLQRHCISLGLGCLLALAALPGLAQTAAAVEVGIIHVNDIYQIAPVAPQEARGGLARLATLVQSIKRRDPETLFVFGGDTLSPSVESSLFMGAQMVAAWNRLGLDLAVPGNHEFDFGTALFRERLQESRFPWLAANIVATPPIAGLQASVLRDIKGVKVGIVGLITPATPSLAKPGPELHFEPLMATAMREVAVLRQQGAQLIIGLTHNSLAEDRQLAASGLFDLILGGHEHQLITELVGRTPIFKAGSDARDALHVRLRASRTDKGWELAGVSWDILPVDARWAEDAAVTADLATYTRHTAELMQTPIATSLVALDARSQTLRTQESNLGNFIADALRQALEADVALINGGGIRGDRLLGPGPLTRHDALSLLPFQNHLVLLAIRGAELLEVLEHGLDRRISRGYSGSMPQIAGMRLEYDPGRAKGERIVRLEIDGKPLDPAASYRLVTSTYLASGGSDFPVLSRLPILRPAEGNPTETEVLIEALQRQGRIAPQVDGRLQVRKP